jgi:tRNA (uracil-5-)-methyltransferase TRM9
MYVGLRITYNKGMQDATISRLLDINRLFYQNFAAPFADTRRRLQPGVVRILAEEIPIQARLVDLGCGNGELAAQLVRRGQRGAYLGLDFSAGLLDEARKTVSKAMLGKSGGLDVDFRAVDLVETDSLESESYAVQPVDVVMSFAVLHHIPGVNNRLNLMRWVREIIGDRPRAVFILSVWQFLNSPRLAQRVTPWETAGLSSGEVDPGDYLLDWRRDGSGLRYVHHYTDAELSALAKASGFEVRRQFLSDGDGGNLGLYQIWTPV